MVKLRILDQPQGLLQGGTASLIPKLYFFVSFGIRGFFYEFIA